MHEVLVNRLGGQSLPSVVRLTDRPDMTLDVYCGRKNNTTTIIYSDVVQRSPLNQRVPDSILSQGI